MKFASGGREGLAVQKATRRLRQRKGQTVRVHDCLHEQCVDCNTTKTIDALCALCGVLVCGCGCLQCVFGAFVTMRLTWNYDVDVRVCGENCNDLAGRRAFRSRLMPLWWKTVARLAVDVNA